MRPRLPLLRLQWGAASKGGDLFLSLHSNAVGSEVDETVDYAVIYVPQDGSGDENGQILADGISLVMRTQQVGRIAAREGNNGDYYGVIRVAVAVETVGLILEHSFPPILAPPIGCWMLPIWRAWQRIYWQG